MMDRIDPIRGDIAELKQTLLRDDPADFANRPVGPLERIGQHQLRAKGAQSLSPGQRPG